LRWTVEDVCRCFHVPLHKLQSGANPTFNNVSAMNQDYYTQCLQTHIESVELLLDEALGLPALNYGTELDLDGLLRMDPAGRALQYKDAIGAGYMRPNEARAKEDLPPVRGGDEVWMQQQNWPISQLAKRSDARSRLRSLRRQRPRLRPTCPRCRRRRATSSRSRMWSRSSSRTRYDRSDGSGDCVTDATGVMASAGRVGSKVRSETKGLDSVVAGPQGDVGPQGPVGDTGPEGPQGPQGDRGSDGRDGVDGELGAQGPQGPQGRIGPMPKHEWISDTRLRFEIAPGKWGATVDLRGPQGSPGHVHVSGGGGGGAGPQGPQGAAGAGTGGDGSVPYFIADGDTFTVPVYRQSLFGMLIDCEGIIDIDGYLVEVD
jgi:hypothetical protein